MKSLTFTLLLMLLAACQVYAQNTGTLGEGPTKIDVEKVAKEPKQVANVKDRQVAVVKIRLRYAEGKLISAETISSRRINSIAPKVFARQSGEWQVIIEGEVGTRTFFVNNPGYLEAEGESEDKPYTYVGGEGEVDWTLIVPLYFDGQDFGATDIRIIERVTENEILKTKI